jgi:antitoxin component YwqK of YwqJK toxin-antitoxin module
MRIKFYAILGTCGVVGLFLSGCRDQKKDDQVVSQRYIHKYGYAVSKEEWDSRSYPGQVITAMRNGITVTATYENGVLHGPSTYTFPHSQTVESYYFYDQGNLAKETHYNLSGMPARETVNHSPYRYTSTMWYAEGSPMSIEEFSNSDLYEGQYFTPANETESRVEKGNGLRIRRDQKGLLVSKDIIESGLMTRRESFYPSGTPESIVHYAKSQLHGEKKTFSLEGEPVAIEEWVNGQLHGKSTYFKNGNKVVEVSYLNGSKNGMEVHYIDGEVIAEEVQWENNKKHGASNYYINGIAQTTWFYDGEEVSRRKFDELNRLDEMISQISPETRITD